VTGPTGLQALSRVPRRPSTRPQQTPWPRHLKHTSRPLAATVPQQVLQWAARCAGAAWLPAIQQTACLRRGQGCPHARCNAQRARHTHECPVRASLGKPTLCPLASRASRLAHIQKHRTVGALAPNAGASQVDICPTESSPSVQAVPTLARRQAQHRQPRACQRDTCAGPRGALPPPHRAARAS
jgi:hypothetical protein